MTGASAKDVVVARSVSKSFAVTGGVDSFVALENVSLTVPEGRFVSIVGPSGCGKSTLLQIVGGLVAASSGDVTVDGEPIGAPRPDKIGIVFQEPLLLPWQTAVENIEFPLALRGEAKDARRRRARELLDLVGLSDFAQSLPHQLSGGMKQRVAIARGLVRHPRLLLMDEPFAALDEQTRTRMWGELLQIRDRSGATVLFVTHSLVEAVYLADEVLVMAARPGRVIERIVVDLPRPRSTDMVGSELLGALRNRIWHLIADPVS